MRIALAEQGKEMESVNIENRPFTTLMKLLAVFVLLFSLLGNRSFGVVLSFVEAPQDDLKVLGPCDTNVCRYPELREPGQKYNELLTVRFFPLKQADVAAIFGPKLDKKPDDFVKPLFGPRMIMESGLGTDEGNKRHVDFHAIGKLGYLEAHYAYNGESMDTCVIYLRADAGFIPLKSTNDIAGREAWDNARFEQLKVWLNDHMPKVNDLGEVEVAIFQPTRIDLGRGTICTITTRDIHCDAVPFWLTFDLAKEMAGPGEREKAMQYKSVARVKEPVGFTMDGKFYQFIPKLVDHLSTTKAPRR
jgi:hypothetical protein